MPIDLDMLVSASPPLYTYSAFVDSQYTRFTSDGYCPTQNYDRGFTIHENNFFNGHRLSSHLRYSKIDSCFDSDKSLRISCSDQITKHSSKDFPCSNVQPENKLREGKRVSFADDKGLALVEVRSVPGIAHDPPKWTHDLFSFITGGIKAKAESPKEKRWKVTSEFSNYTQSTLAEKLESNLVVLESAVVDEDGSENILKGTIKVRNTTYTKEVILRVTFDRWVSYEDVHCNYNQPNPQDDNICNFSAHDFDAFTFEISIPQSASRYEVVEFCVCYRADGQEFWDNNGGINYRLVATPITKTPNVNTKQLSTKKEPISPQFSPIVEDLTTFPRMDMWETLLNEQSYW